MTFDLIFEGRIESTSVGGELVYRLPQRAGGRSAKQANYMILVVQSTQDANLRITLVLDHGPNGRDTTSHSTPIAYADPGATLPAVMSGDSDSTKMLGEFLAPVLKIKTNTGSTQQWAFVKVYETRKPF